MKKSGIALYTTEQIRSCEQLALSTLALTEQELMQNAGLAAFSSLQQHFPKAHNLVVFCGSGNNAGDGYVLARLAHEAGYAVTINQYKLATQLPAAAKAAAQAAIEAGVPCQFMDEAIEQEPDLIIDALLGIGLSGPVTEPILGAINQINHSGLPVLSLDIPSGLDADTGQVLGVAVRASLTLSFIGIKLGMMTLDGPDYSGEISCNDLNLGSCLSQLDPLRILSAQNLKNNLPSRAKNCHKGDFGHVLVIGGGEGMPGAAYLAAQAALRVGAGLVTIATRPEYAAASLPGLPEALVYGIETPKELRPLIEKATICLIGPGLGEDSWAEQLFLHLFAAQLPMIIDASALRILAKNPQQDDSWVLTPHPGEAARLLNCSVQTIQSNRLKALLTIQKIYGGQVVLKGVGTLVATEEEQRYLCAAGNPGMATAGMGDVLSGVIAGLAAQGLSLAQAATAGVWLHAKAGDLAAARGGERGLLASDLMPYLRDLVNNPSLRV